jgi:hypothetical protein
MRSNWKVVGLATLLAGALAAPTLAADSDTPPSIASLAKQLETVKQQLEALQKTVDSLKGLPNSIASLTRTLEKLDKDGAGLKAVQTDLTELKGAGLATDLKIQTAQNSLNDLSKEVTQLRKDFDTLKTRPPSPQIAGYPPPANATLGTGRVRLVNTFADPMTIIVNGKAYHVQPGETRLSDPVPAGAFTYEVLGVQPPLERQLASNQTFTVTVFPR